MGNLGFSEMALVFMAVVLLFGGNKIPELMRGLGQGIAEFKKAKNAVEDEIRKGINDTDKQ